MTKGTLPQRLFDVEHALALHAHSYVHMPAFAIYEDELIAKYVDIMRDCHIYLIGYAPKLFLDDIRQEGKTLLTKVIVDDKAYTLDWQLADGDKLVVDKGLYYVLSLGGNRFFPSDELVIQRIGTAAELVFDVQYVGQSYGKDGSRNALDRLKKHETLQKIAIRGIPPGKNLTLLMFEILPMTKIISVFNPNTQDQSHGEARIKNGLDKLYGTSAQERVSLYEASLIRYFQPKFNKALKDSFPSTNLKVLKDCYDKDFAAIVAEICIDELPFLLASEQVPKHRYHIIHHPLHSAEERRMFFG